MVVGGVTVVVTSVMTTVVGVVVTGSSTGVLAGSLMMPSHSSPVISVVSLGVSVVVSAGVGACGVSSAKTGVTKELIVATELIKIRVKNNLTIFLIIFYYIMVCINQQEVV